MSFFFVGCAAVRETVGLGKGLAGSKSLDPARGKVNICKLCLVDKCHLEQSHLVRRSRKALYSRWILSVADLMSIVR